MHVRDAMSTQVLVVGPHHTLVDAARVMLQRRVGAAIVVDADLQTSRAGVFAAGDVVSGAYARIAAAMGQGSVAARSVLRYLQGRP